jgi:hypothetical protein
MFGEICDIFAFMNLDGSIGIESGAKWTNSTTRSVQLAMLDGALVKQGDSTRLFVGTVMCWSDFGMLDTESYRHCWNMYNRVPRPMFYAPDDQLTTSWIYTSNTIQRRAGDSNPNGLWYVSGMPTMFSAEIVVDSTSPPGSGVAVYPGVGIDGSGTTYASGSYSVASFADQYTAGVVMPPWFGDDAFHASHRSNLLRKNFEYSGSCVTTSRKASSTTGSRLPSNHQARQV